MRSFSALLGLISPAVAQYLVNELSFGYDGKISPSNDGRIPNYSLQGNPNEPEILSNKIILTPPAPGNQRAAIWADKPLQHTQWVADVDFRASGPEHAGGNLNIWLTRDPKDVGTSSVYQVGKFEGLALVLYTYGSGTSMVRGFLNDGSKDYSKMTVDGQSFGHCDHAYRNLGRPSQIKFRQTVDNFKVEIDGQLCFESNKISIPPGYKLGITAASADNPDSFEIFKMVVMSENVDPSQDTHHQQVLSSQDGSTHDGGFFGGSAEAKNPPAYQAGSSGRWDSSFEDDIADADAATITSSAAQFADLHERLQSTNHHLSVIFSRMSQSEIHGETRHAELAKQLDDLKGLFSKLDKIDSLENKITNLESEMRKLKGDVTNKVNSAERSIKGAVKDTHAELHDTVREHASPGHGRLIAVIIGSQLVMVAGYIIYKKKKSTPKKYL